MKFRIDIYKTKMDVLPNPMTKAKKDKLIQKFICAECGGKYTTYNQGKHNQTKKHNKSIANKNNKVSE